MKFEIASLAAASLAVSSNALKVGVVSDLHLNLEYDSWASVDDNCFSSSTGKEDS